MDFSGAPGDPDDLGEQVAAMWVAGASRPGWCFVAEDESGARVGRVGYRVEPTVTNPAWLGSLPPAELFPFGLWLPWEHGGCDLGRVLFATTLGRLAPELPARLDARVNPEIDDHPGDLLAQVVGVSRSAAEVRRIADGTDAHCHRATIRPPAPMVGCCWIRRRVRGAVCAGLGAGLVDSARISSSGVIASDPRRDT